MRGYIRALLMCTVFAALSGLYVYSTLFEANMSAGGNGAKRVYGPPRVLGPRHGDPDKAGPQSSHRHNRYIMRQRGRLEVDGRRRPQPSMHLAVVACGERLEETVTMLKSAVLFSIKGLQLHIFAEDQLHTSFMEALESWPAFIRSRFNYTVYPIRFPSDNAAEWKKLFKPCASQRLFLPNDMTSVGLRWEELLMPLLQKYKLNITWGDQDLLNIIFHYNPELLLEFPCQWNYRPDHCIYGSNCASAEDNGIYILHGNRGVYHDHKQPAFKSVYEAIRKVTLCTSFVLSQFVVLQLNNWDWKHLFVRLQQIRGVIRKLISLPRGLLWAVSYYCNNIDDGAGIYLMKPSAQISSHFY
ncbi:glucoside xylosyltransferase 1 isoform X4 [Phycodurus eques]|uniref:glucoside xylosyltransferase 1 isoform X4 n=1 Tax=Phycodurus eques TaxID=693459 RepID=UPI002ACD913D|nr:glucoside xylosyltransferase 1 isoform X4 [Phycodurus eques]